MMSVMTMTGRKLAFDPFSGDITTWTSYNKHLDLHMLLMQRKKWNFRYLESHRGTRILECENHHEDLF